MMSQGQLPLKTSDSLKHTINVLVNALQNTAASSAKFLIYLVATVSLLNIIGYENINSLVSDPTIRYVIKGIAASSIIQRVVDQIGGDLFANIVDRLARRDSLTDDKILAFIENQINPNELSELIENVIQQSPLLKEKDFFRALARQQREGQKQTAMLEFLVEYAVGVSKLDNIPYQLPSRTLIENFVDREDELKQLMTNLQPGKTIVITGSGGVGKSALTAKALWQIHEDFELLNRFPDGVVTYDCSLQSDIRLASSFIAHNFEYPAVNDPNIIKDILTRKKALLIFDNAEEVAELEILVSGLHSCGVIITSRKYLEIDGIHIALQGLTYTQGEELLNKLLHSDMPIDSTSIHELIQELEGLPLALALASKYIQRKSYNTTTYLRFLRDSLKALEFANNRQQSLPLIIQQSIQVVSKVARLILLVMGGHAHRPLTDVTFSIALHPNFQYSQEEIRHALVELIEHNLVQVQKLDFDDGKYIPRYEPKHGLIYRYVREYSSQQWNEEWNKILDRIVSNLVLGPLELFINEPTINEEFYSDSLYLDALVLQENLLREKRWEEAIHCSEVLYSHAQHKGDSTEKSQILRAGLRATIELNDKFRQTNILHELGSISLLERDLDNSEKYLNQALELSKIDKNVENEVKILNTLASVSFDYEHPKQAVSLLEAAIELAIRENYTGPLGDIYFNLGNAQLANDDQNDAVTSFEKASFFAVRNNQQKLNLSAKTLLGNTYQSLGQFTKAEFSYRDAMAIAQAQNDVHAYAVNLGNLGLLHKQLNNKNDAIRCLKEALDIFEGTNEEYTQLTRKHLKNLLQEQ